MASAAEEIAALRGTRPAGLKDLLVDPSFSRLWRAMLVSSLGDWVGFVAVASLVAQLGGRSLAGFAVAGVMLARLLPSVLFGPIAGVLVDRFDRRRMMIGADIARGGLYAAMPFLPTLWAIYLLSFFIECLSLLWTTSKDSSVPNMVPRRQLSNANSVSLVTTYGTLPLGAIIATSLAGIATKYGGHTFIATTAESLALWLDSLTFLFSAWMVWGLRLPPPTRRRGAPGAAPALSVKTAWADIRDGIRFLREHRLVRAMSIGIGIGFTAAGAVIALGPVFARYSVDAGATGFGILMTALGIGLGCGMGAATFLSRRYDKDLIFSVALMAAAASLFVLAFTRTIEVAALFTIPMGAGAGVAWVMGYTMLQENITDEFRGRTFATLTTIVRMALFVSLAVFPALAGAIGKAIPGGEVALGPLRFDGTRVSLIAASIAAFLAGLSARGGLRRSRIARSVALTLEPHVRKVDGVGGVFIAFEGGEGAGKGTQIELARAYVESRGLQVLVTREPGGTDFGENVRKVALDPSTGRIDPRAEALLFAASRAQLVSAVIRPALEEGKIVLCDRYIDSSIAYQGVGRGLGEQDVLTLNAWATQGLFPELTILLDVEPQYGLLRSEGVADRIEFEDPSFHTKVAQAYLKIAEEHPERCVVVDAGGSEEEVHARVREALDRVLGRVEEGRAGAT
ncbi:MAG TPA: dTMP kinase [Actinomycetota bacterium]|nr:dTMP kinase [Actinomycetota bacterium]